MTTKKSKLVGIYPEPTSINEESTNRILTACAKILELCADEKLTINDMQFLPDILSMKIRRAISSQIANEIFKNITI